MVHDLLELPPRARRIQVWLDESDGIHGTTSACAENTLACRNASTSVRNYLRVRGEYRFCSEVNMWVSELPPRARRIHIRLPRGEILIGTTSACAENTRIDGLFDHPQWNYLRVRGEYRRLSTRSPLGTELPPRARRIQASGVKTSPSQGTTSACAENTSP